MPNGTEDKLTHDERLRLECVAQAVSYASAICMARNSPPPSTAAILNNARSIQTFVSDGTQDDER